MNPLDLDGLEKSLTYHESMNDFYTSPIRCEFLRALIAEVKRLRKAEAFLCKQLPSLARAFEFGDDAVSGEAAE